MITFITKYFIKLNFFSAFSARDAKGLESFPGRYSFASTMGILLSPNICIIFAQFLGDQKPENVYYKLNVLCLLEYIISATMKQCVLPLICRRCYCRLRSRLSNSLIRNTYIIYYECHFLLNINDLPIPNKYEC